MEIYLIRHTTPAVATGICYGQTDLDVTNTFTTEANIIKNIVPNTVHQIYSSPLQRCTKLATHVFPHKQIELHHHLKEINCGQWEMQAWNDIAKEEITPWMENFVHVRMPQGENYIDVYNRVTAVFNTIVQQRQHAAIVAHGGVLRSILSYITNTPLIDSFKAFTLHYGCVVKINWVNDVPTHTILSNIPHAKETHKPT